VYSVCSELLEEISNQFSLERATDEKIYPNHYYHGHLGWMYLKTAL
jgi:hypothetical protein